ncbi:cytochrome P450 [Mycena floridula]|nr:cytochrome P450 [Mycena floridula]
MSFKAAPFPPGPKGLPIFGNLRDIPTESAWKTYAEWGQRWGGIVYINVGGKHMFIVNSGDIMKELERVGRGVTFAGRPRLEFAGELVGYSKTLVLHDFSPRFEQFRTYFAGEMGSHHAVQKYHTLLETESVKFLQHMLNNPQELVKNLRRTAGSIIMQLAYGIEVQDDSDPFIELIEEANDNFSAATTPGAFAVDFVPSLRYIPSWFPGAGFKKLADQFRQAFNDMVEKPYIYSKLLISSGEARDSFVNRALENHGATLTDNDVFNIKHTAASIYGGGADTTVSSQHGFVLAMILHPEVQKAAQAEIDRVCPGRLPNLGDRHKLEYVEALVKETFRWHNIAPLGVPHTALEDTVVQGYGIPTGSIIITNLWAMLHDPATYPNPFVFDPTRFMGDEKSQQADPRRLCFGFARRICPGRYLAHDSLWIYIATLLAVFNITNAVDEAGDIIVPVHENTSGTISHPKPFQFSIQPRHPGVAALIEAAASGA